MIYDHASTRRLLFLLLFAVVLFQTGARISYTFVNTRPGAISRDSFPEHHRVMTNGARWLFMLPRVVEVVLAIVVLCFRPAVVKRWMLALAITLTLCALLSTAFIQRPIHVQLETMGNVPELLSRSRATTWLQLTPEWLRAALYLWMMSLVIRPHVQAGL